MSTRRSSKPKNETTDDAAAAEETESASASSSSSGAPKKAPRGRHVAGWLESRYGEGTGKEWPKAAEEMWPLLCALLTQNDFARGDVRVKVSRVSGAAGETGETPCGKFDASCIDTANPDDAIREYVEDWYQIPAEKAGIEGPCLYRISFQDKHTGQIIKTAELHIRSAREIKAARGLRAGAKPNYQGEAPAFARAPSIGGAPLAQNSGDPYTADALHNLRVEMARDREELPRVVASVLRELRGDPPPAAAPKTPAPDPIVRVPESLDQVIAALRKLGVIQETQIPQPAAAAPPRDPDEVDELVKRVRKKLLEEASQKVEDFFTSSAGGGGRREEPIHVTATPVDHIPTPTAEPLPKAPFRGLEVEGAPTYKGERIRYPVDQQGNFSFRGLAFTNPQVAMDFLEYLKEAGQPVVDLFTRFMERDANAQAAAAAAAAQQNGTNGASHHAHVTSSTPAGAHDAGSGDTDPRQGAS